MEPDPDELAHPGQEDLQWGSGVTDKERKKRNAPSAKYNKLSEQARKLIAGESQCAMFCGGKKCKYCTTENWKPEQMAIKGLYSEWVTDNIMAMARPSNHGLDKHQILEQFEETNIRTVINLQQPGEHASCGYGNDSSGFSYSPQRLMEKQIFFYNFAWQDYGIAPMSTLLDIVKVMQFGVATGKVAVHCHAGLGRTGLLIACYLVFNNRVDAAEAVRYVRSRRAGAIQTGQQVQTVLDFETHLKPFRTVFPSKVPWQSEVCFKHFLNRQGHLLHGFEGRRLKHIPKVVYVCCERLLTLGGQGQGLPKDQTSIDTPSSSPSAPSCSQPLPLISSSAHSLALPTFSQLSVHSAHNLNDLVHSGMQSRISVCLEDLPNTKFKKILTEGDEDDDSSSSTSQDVFISDVTAQSMHTKSSGSASGRGALNDRAGTKAAEGSGGVDGARDGGRESEQEEEEEEEEDDDDCIVFGKPDIIVVKKDESPRNSLCVNSSALKPVSDDVESDRSTCVDNSGTLGGRSSKDRASSDGTTDGVRVRDSSSNNDISATGKRKGKRKGLGERLKNRTKNKGEVKSSCVDVGQEKDGVGSDDKSSGSRQGTRETGVVSDSGSGVVSGSSELWDAVSPRGAVPVKGTSRAVCEAMASTEYRSDVRKKADQIEAQLNVRDSAWALLAEEQDPCVISAVLWDWLNQLKEPVLRKQDLVHILERQESPKHCLRHLEKSIKHFVEYLALVLSKMFPQSEELETRLVQSLLSHLTHQAPSLVGPTIAATTTTTAAQQPQQQQPSHWGEMRSSEATRLLEFFFKLIDEVASPLSSSLLEHS